VGVGLIVYGSRQMEGESIYGRKMNVFGRVSRSIKKLIQEFF